jgi:hypothetical protein
VYCVQRSNLQYGNADSAHNAESSNAAVAHDLKHPIPLSTAENAIACIHKPIKMQPSSHDHQTGEDNSINDKRRPKI